MEIEMTPRIGNEILNRSIKRSRASHQYHQRRRIRRVDVVVMHYLEMAVLIANLANQVSHGDDHDDDEEDEQVYIAEGHNKLGDGVVGHHLGQQPRFPRPAYPVVFRGELHPHRVDAVLRHHADVGNHQEVILLDAERIHLQSAEHLLGLLPGKEERVLEHQKIKLIGIMMCGREAYAISLSLAEE